MTAIAAASHVVGGGSNAGANVLRLRFPNAPLAGQPILEAYSASGTPPVLNLGTSEDEPFSEDDSCVFAIPTYGVTTPGSALANWASAITAGDASNFGTGYNANGRKLQGTTSTLQLVPNAVTSFPSGFTAGFNLSYRVGVDTGVNPGDNAFVLAARYIYTGGTDPTVVWEANSAAASGTDASPVWRSIAGNDSDFLGGSPVATPRKIIHANAGADNSNPVITKPESGKEYSKKLVLIAS